MPTITLGLGFDVSALVSLGFIRAGGVVPLLINAELNSSGPAAAISSKSPGAACTGRSPGTDVEKL
jgi:hypothetical protein